MLLATRPGNGMVFAPTLLPLLAIPPLLLLAIHTLTLLPLPRIAPFLLLAIILHAVLPVPTAGPPPLYEVKVIDTMTKEV